MSIFILIVLLLLTSGSCVAGNSVKGLTPVKAGVPNSAKANSGKHKGRNVTASSAQELPGLLSRSLALVPRQVEECPPGSSKK